ncbi:RHS repeat-associated core domain-containing protein [Ohtaekwangia kribbensis]|uniref:RHS repeat-associated core domain-containing protein n=1 Tax=Ohtaekwangia kribbensis TaxID=688913 RepID=A0ABW3K607_9BACT
MFFEKGCAGLVCAYEKSGIGLVEVYFDDFNVEHTKSPVIQAEDYYPFGLSFNSYSRENSMQNAYKFNGIKEQDDLGLNVYEAFYRTMDPTIGRWWQIDPKINYDFSPYCSMNDNPILYNDPLGDEVDPSRTKGMNFMVVANAELRKQDREHLKASMKGPLKGLRAFFSSAYTVDNIKARSMQVLSLGKLKVISAGNPTEAVNKMKDKLGSDGYVKNLTIDYHAGQFGTASLNSKESDDAFKTLQQGYAGYQTTVLLGQCWAGGNPDLTYPTGDQTDRISKALDGATVYGNKAAASSIGFVFRNTFTGPIYQTYRKSSGNLLHYGEYSKSDVMTPTPVTTTNRISVRNSGEIEEKD